MDNIINKDNNNYYYIQDQFQQQSYNNQQQQEQQSYNHPYNNIIVNNNNNNNNNNRYNNQNQILEQSYDSIIQLKPVNLYQSQQQQYYNVNYNLMVPTTLSPPMVPIEIIKNNIGNHIGVDSNSNHIKHNNINLNLNHKYSGPHDNFGVDNGEGVACGATHKNKNCKKLSNNGSGGGGTLICPSESNQCHSMNCLLCSRGKPSSLSNYPTWSSIMKVVLYTLHFLHPEKRYFSLKYEIYNFMKVHWDSLSIPKKKSTNWRKQIQDMLSHSKSVFASGANSIGQNGYWGLVNICDPWGFKITKFEIIPSPSPKCSQQQYQFQQQNSFQQHQQQQCYPFQQHYYIDNKYCLENNQIVESPLPPSKNLNCGQINLTSFLQSPADNKSFQNNYSQREKDNEDPTTITIDPTSALGQDDKLNNIKIDFLISH